MKITHFFILFLIVSFCLPAMAQKPLKITKFGIELGVDKDMIQGMSSQKMFSRTNSDVGNLIDAELGDEYTYNMICENPNVRATIVMEPAFFKNTEIQTSLNFIWGRLDAISYYEPNNWDGDYNHYHIDMSGSEVDLEASIVKRLDVKWMKLYGGAGFNVGYHFNNWLWVNGAYSEEIMERGDRSIREIFNPAGDNYHFSNYSDSFHYSERVGNGTSTRLFAQAGIGFVILKRVELGMNYRYGYGLRTYNKGDNDFTNLQSWGLNLKYVLK